MPYKCEKIRLTEKQDRRKKLTEQDKEKIYTMYHFGNDDNIYSWSGLANLFGVSKKTIGNIVNVKMGEKSKEQSREFSKNHKPTKEYRNRTMQSHRSYKQSLYLQNLLEE